MPMRIYNKLVRDKIPGIIEKNGGKCRLRILNDEEYLAALDRKLSEELSEYLESGSMEEIADLLEVIRAVIAARGSTMDEVEAIRAAKAAERGAFDKKIELISVEDGI